MKPNTNEGGTATKPDNAAPTESEADKAKRLAAEKAAKDKADAEAAEKADKAKREAMFNALPTITLHEDTTVVDLSSVPTTQPYKYDKVHADAMTDRLPIRRGWKHASAMFVPGTNKGGENGFRAGSVYGTIADIANRAGRGGISAQALCTELRKRQIGNKRSKYCENLPPVGWAEGWVDTAVTRQIVGVHATKKAPALVAPAAPAEPKADPGKTAEQKAA
jgi:hypothetical protein